MTLGWFGCVCGGWCNIAYLCCGFSGVVVLIRFGWVVVLPVLWGFGFCGWFLVWGLDCLLGGFWDFGSIWRVGATCVVMFGLVL